MKRPENSRNPGARAGAAGAATNFECARNSREEYRGIHGSSTARELRYLAAAVRRIHDPLRSNPEAVYAAKDAIARRLLTLSRAMEAAHA